MTYLGGIRKDKPIPFDEAIRILESRFGYETLPIAIQNLEKMFQWVQSKKGKPPTRRLPQNERQTFDKCVECGEETIITAQKAVGDDEVCQDCYDAMCG